MVHTVLSYRSVRDALDVPVSGTRVPDTHLTWSIDGRVDKQRIMLDGSSYDLL